MAITVVLADGFDGHDVELSAQGVAHTVEDVTTSLMDGTAAEIDVTGDGPFDVGARIVRGHGAQAAPQPEDVVPDHHQDHPKAHARAEDSEPLAQFSVPDGATLVLSYDERGLSGVVHTAPVAFD